jgi:hypothetical protein
MNDQFNGPSTLLKKYTREDANAANVDNSQSQNEGNISRIYKDHTDDESCVLNSQFDGLSNFLKEYTKKYGNNIYVNCEVFHSNRKQSSSRNYLISGGEKYKNYRAPRYGKYGISKKRNYMTPSNVTSGISIKKYITPGNVNRNDQKHEQIGGSGYSHTDSVPKYNSLKNSGSENVVSREYIPRPFAAQFDFIRIQYLKFAAERQ